jgi:hypothetical protein
MTDGKRTIAEVLAARGLRKGTPEWADAAARILAGDAEWERLSHATPAEIEQELDMVAVADDSGEQA